MRPTAHTLWWVHAKGCVPLALSLPFQTRQNAGACECGFLNGNLDQMASFQSTYKSSSRIEIPVWPEVQQAVLTTNKAKCYPGRPIFFLHGYRRYVCREAQVTIDEFEKKDEKIRARAKDTQQPEHQNPKTTKPKTQGAICPPLQMPALPSQLRR